jgi:hypothetical protein
MPAIVASTEVERPAAEVFAYASAQAENGSTLDPARTVTPVSAAGRYRSPARMGHAGGMGAHRDGVSHWDDVYAGGDASRSWFQACPLMSLKMLDAAGVTASDSLIDVGGGASRLAGVLLGRGFRDITVLDISVTGMRYAQDHLGEQAQQVQWLAADVLAWEPHRRFRVWHDRAVFHFLTSPPGQHRYLSVLDAATETGAVAVFGCFAPDGPDRCSGLPVARYDIPALAGHLGQAWTLCAGDHEEHITPGGMMQPFTWAAFHKAPGSRPQAR